MRNVPLLPRGTFLFRINYYITFRQGHYYYYYYCSNNTSNNDVAYILHRTIPYYATP